MSKFLSPRLSHSLQTLSSSIIILRRLPELSDRIQIPFQTVHMCVKGFHHLAHRGHWAYSDGPLSKPGTPSGIPATFTDWSIGIVVLSLFAALCYLMYVNFTGLLRGHQAMLKSRGRPPLPRWTSEVDEKLSKRYINPGELSVKLMQGLLGSAALGEKDDMATRPTVTGASIQGSIPVSRCGSPPRNC